MNVAAIQNAPTKVLYRAFERLRRVRGPWAPTECPETRAIVLIAMADELSRRGWHDAGCLWAPQHAADSLDGARFASVARQRDDAWRRYHARARSVT